MRSTHALAIAVFSMIALPVAAQAGGPRHCPPGLARKSPPCIPPGLADKGYPFRVGERLAGDYVLLPDPWRYGLDRRGRYYRVGDYLYRVDEETLEVLELIGAIARVLD